MFGDSWEPAMATIVAKKFKTGSVESGSVYTYIADVRPDSGAEAFRTELHEPTFKSSFRSPSEGSTVRVEANVKKQKAKFDVSDPNLSSKTAFQAENDTFAAAKAGAVGSPAHPVDVLNGEDPRLQLVRMRIKTATMQGDTAEIARLEEMRRKIEAGELPMPTSAPGPLGATPAAADPLDRLKKLADLHAAGALTDAEFAEQKAKILEQT